MRTCTCWCAYQCITGSVFAQSDHTTADRWLQQGTGDRVTSSTSKTLSPVTNPNIRTTNCFINMDQRALETPRALTNHNLWTTITGSQNMDNTRSAHHNVWTEPPLVPITWTTALFSYQELHHTTLESLRLIWTNHWFPGHGQPRSSHQELVPLGPILMPMDVWVLIQNGSEVWPAARESIGNPTAHQNWVVPMPENKTVLWITSSLL